jgi:hypothetical protein
MQGPTQQVSLPPLPLVRLTKLPEMTLRSSPWFTGNKTPEEGSRILYHCAVGADLANASGSYVANDTIFDTSDGHGEQIVA